MTRKCKADSLRLWAQHFLVGFFVLSAVEEVIGNLRNLAMTCKKYPTAHLAICEADINCHLLTQYLQQGLPLRAAKNTLSPY